MKPPELVAEEAAAGPSPSLATIAS
jgi:hypothetical protein